MRTLLVTIALGIGMSAQARPPLGGAPDIDTHVAHMTERLGLTAEQEAQIRTIIETTHAEAEGLRASASAAVESLIAARAGGDEGAMDAAIHRVLEARAEAEMLRDATQEQVRSVLTTSQAADLILAESARRHMGEMRIRGERPPPTPRNHRLKGL